MPSAVRCHGVVRGNQSSDKWARGRRGTGVRLAAAPLLLLLEFVAALLVSHASSAPGAPYGLPATVATSSTSILLLGTPDWNGYCEATGQHGARLDAAQHAYGWHCTVPTRYGASPRAVCRWTFGTSRAVDVVTDFYDPDSWQCWQVGGELGRLDFGAYCRRTGHAGAVLVRENAYGWYCTDDTAGIDADQACDLLYGGTDVARFQNFYDKDSWQCWG